MWRYCTPLVLLASCSSAPATSADLAQLDLAEPAIAAPAGFWAPCTSSPECRIYPQDAPPGFLGCQSFVGVNHCTRPCGAGWPSCWGGTSCSCTDHVNAGGLHETVCWCAPSTPAPAAACDPWNRADVGGCVPRGTPLLNKSTSNG